MTEPPAAASATRSSFELLAACTGGHRPLPVLVAAVAVVGEHVGVRRHVEVGVVGRQRGDARRPRAPRWRPGRCRPRPRPPTATGWSGPAAPRTPRRRGSPPRSPGRPRTAGRSARPAAAARWSTPAPAWRRGVAVVVEVVETAGGARRGRRALARRGRRRRSRAARRQQQGHHECHHQSQLQARTGFPAHRASMASTGGRYGAPMATTRDITYEADGRTMIGTLALPEGERRSAPASWSATRDRASTTTPRPERCAWPTSSATSPSPSTTTATASRSPIASR